MKNIASAISENFQKFP